METFDKILKEFKRKLSTKRLIIRFIPTFSRIKIVGLIILILVLGQFESHESSPWYWLPMIIAAFYLFWYVNKLVLSIRADKYGSKKGFQDARYSHFLDILKANQILIDNPQITRDRIITLLDILNTKLSKRKISTRFYSLLGALIIIGIKGNIFGVIKSKLGVLPEDVLYLTLVLIIQLIGILLAITPVILEFLDRNYEKMREMRDMLYEILLKRI